MKKLLYLIAILSVNGAYGRDNRLERLYHHKSFAKDHRYLELGNLVFYFAKTPKLDSVIDTKNSATEKRTIFIPDAAVSSAELRSVIAGVNKSDGPYSVWVKEVSSPKKGLRITVVYNPSRVSMELKTFESMDHKQCVMLQFYDKKLLDRISDRTAPLLQTASRSVIIDCGHGGNDPGALGCNNRYEKDICLPVGIEVARVLQAHGITAHLTRTDDSTLRLDERTSFANGVLADLFVSVHANSCDNAMAHGIETYFLDHTLFCSIESDKRMYEGLRSKCQRSKQLASAVQGALLGTLKSYQVKDRAVRPTMLSVLMGTAMPAVLVEIGFMSHAREAQLLAHAQYQKQVAAGIAHGILNYLSR